MLAPPGAHPTVPGLETLIHGVSIKIDLIRDNSAVCAGCRDLRFQRHHGEELRVLLLTR